MPGPNAKLTEAVQAYFGHLRSIRASGGATDERSYYPPLANLLDAMGGSLRPKVFCVSEMAQQGAGHPDFGLYSSTQLQKGKVKQGQSPERGVVEVKPVGDDAWLTADSGQVSQYWDHYRLVLVTNTRDFVLLGEDAEGQCVKLETFRLAGSVSEFEVNLQHPVAFARDVGPAFGEYLYRALSHRARLAEPRDLAWLMASYARDGLARVEAAGDVSSLNFVRAALEEALGVKFEGARGAAFFRSTLVQTLFYGVFSAWVLWSRQNPGPMERFNWHETAQLLRVPILRELFWQLSNPGQLQPLGLNEVLDWTADALERVDREAFFTKFDEGEAVPYFYEPFLEAFDPVLRKQLGVWYTPAEVVRYMVARVDRALKDDLDIEDGLAAENVYVLDPCCGTGAYLAETLKRIAANLEGKGLGALTGSRVKQAATQRVFGFELMPAPFVVAHLQVGLTMQALNAPLAENGEDRAGVFLTNALTGWEPRAQKPLPISEFDIERNLAEQVKQETPVLVILGNPPYNGFAGMAVDEERELSLGYRTTNKVRKPQGRGLNDLYVRFFRMAERRITEKTGQGIVCFISNYSWLDGQSFTGMRERYLEAFDTILIDCLNGDKYRTGKTTPDGGPDPSVFSTTGDPIGIQVGTAIATLIRKPDHIPTKNVNFRDLWGTNKLDRLTETAEVDGSVLYDLISPALPLGLPFAAMASGDDWLDWPTLPDLFPATFPGVTTGRDSFLIDIDMDQVKARMEDYFNSTLGNEEIGRRHPSIMDSTRRYDAIKVRNALLQRDKPDEASGFIRYAYRPFDSRWLYWEGETKLLDEKRADYKRNMFDRNSCLVFQRKARPEFSPPLVISVLGDFNQMNSGVYCVPLFLRDEGLGLGGGGAKWRSNLSHVAQQYLDHLGLEVEDLFHHALAVLHDPSYREANAGALRMEWPRIPLPGWPEGDVPGAAKELAASASRGRELASLLDPETPVPGVTTGALSPEIRSIAVPSTIDGGNMGNDDFELTVGWGHFGTGDAVMPGVGRTHERPCTPGEQAAAGDATVTLGETTFDVYLNDRAFWRNIPANVWNYKLGGYQVLKKWLSYRGSKVLGRPLLPEEVQHFTDTARRIVAILLLVNQT